MQLIAGRYRPSHPLKSTTWLGHDQETGQPVVLRYGEPSPGRWLRLTHEAEALRKVGGLLYFDRQVLVRTYYEGPTLAEALPHENARQLAQAIVKELQRYHSHDLLHGDLKPANIILQEDRVRLIDSGLGGTPLYLAPEAAGTLRNHRTGPWTDLYSLGATLYEMLIGHPPFQAPDLGELLRQHLTSPVPPTGQPRMDAILRRLLAKSPDERYQTAEAVAHDLEHLPAVVGATDRRVTLAAPSFIARQEELELLQQTAPHRRLILLEAPPGGGKTRLLDELHQRSPRRVLRGQATTQSSPAPLGLFADIIKEANLKDAAAGLADLLETLDALVLLDDVQWADPASLEALARWARVPGPGATIVAACRQNELPRAIGHHEHLVLPPLSHHELHALWASMGGPTEGLERLEALCEGNPFLAIEGLRGHREGELTSARGSALLERRLQHLSPQALRALANASLIGKRFPLELFEDPALEESRRAGLLWIDDHTAEFTHDRLREAVKATVDNPEEVHRKAAAYFESRGDRQAQAYHWHHSGDAGVEPLALEVARHLRARHALGEALQFYEMVPQEHLERGEVHALLGHYDEASREYRQAQAPDELTQARLLFRLGQLEYRQDRMPQAVPYLERALKTLGLPLPGFTLTSRQKDEPKLRLGLQIYKFLTDALGHQGDDILGFLTVLFVGGQFARHLPDSPEAGVIMADLGAAISLFNSPGVTGFFYERALRGTAAVPDSVERGQVLSRASCQGFQQRNPALAITCARQAVRILGGTSEAWELDQARFILATFYRAQGRTDEVRTLAQGILTTSAQVGVEHHVWQARALLAMQGEHLVGPAAAPGTTALCYQAVAEALAEIQRGQPQAALEIFEKYRPPRLLVPADHVVLLVWTATAARLSAEQCPFEAGAQRQDYYRKARRAARQAVKTARYFRVYLPHALREAALLARARGHEARAASLFQQSLHEAEHYPLEAERTRRALKGEAEPTPPAVHNLTSLVDWSRRLLTSPDAAQLQETLQKARADLRPDPQLEKHLAEMVRTAEANLRELQQRQEATHRLEASRARLHAVLESAGVALALIDRDKNILAQNSLFTATAFLKSLTPDVDRWDEDDTHLWRARWSDAGAVITGTPIGHEALARFQESERKALEARLRDLTRHPELQSAFDSIHYNLRGELAAAPNLAERLALITRNIPLDLEMPASLPLSDLGRLALERILCEGVHNAVHHGRPTRIRVRIEVTPEHVVARLDDDGRGFHPETDSARRGLKGMRWRAELAGGTLQVRSSPERGTTLEVRLCATAG